MSVPKSWTRRAQYYTEQATVHRLQTPDSKRDNTMPVEVDGDGSIRIERDAHLLSYCNISCMLDMLPSQRRRPYPVVAAFESDDGH